MRGLAYAWWARHPNQARPCISVVWLSIASVVTPALRDLGKWQDPAETSSIFQPPGSDFSSLLRPCQLLLALSVSYSFHRHILYRRHAWCSFTLSELVQVYTAGAISRRKPYQTSTTHFPPSQFETAWYPCGSDAVDLAPSSRGLFYHPSYRARSRWRLARVALWIKPPRCYGHCGLVTLRLHAIRNECTLPM